MSQPFRIIVGLGNPGEDYAHTRHNIGFLAADAVADRFRCRSWKKRFKSLASGTSDFLIIKPQTFMNLSGEAVGEAARFYRVTSDNIIVFHDDLDLVPGQVKIKRGGGSGGHNGLKSLDAHIGPDYWRVRMGIGRPVTEQGLPVKGDAVTNYVLNPFSKADRIWLEPLLSAVGENAGLIVEAKFNAFLSKLAH